MTFVETPTIAHELKIGQSLRVLTVCDGSPFYKPLRTNYGHCGLKKGEKKEKKETHQPLLHTILATHRVFSHSSPSKVGWRKIVVYV